MRQDILEALTADGAQKMHHLLKSNLVQVRPHQDNLGDFTSPAAALDGIGVVVMDGDHWVCDTDAPSITNKWDLDFGTLTSERVMTIRWLSLWVQNPATGGWRPVMGFSLYPPCILMKGDLLRIKAGDLLIRHVADPEKPS